MWWRWISTPKPIHRGRAMTGRSPYIDAMDLLRSIRDELQLLSHTPGWTHALLEARVNALAATVREQVSRLEPGSPNNGSGNPNTS
jgi:hypothetical protein